MDFSKTTVGRILTLFLVFACVDFSGPLCTILLFFKQQGLTEGISSLIITTFLQNTIPSHVLQKHYMLQTVTTTANYSTSL